MGAVLHFTEILRTWWGILILIVVAAVIYGFWKWMMGEPEEASDK